MTNRVTQLGAVNAYLVREEDGLTLVDTLMQGGQKRILAAAQTLGAPIVRIALTHAHGDHIGSLDKLAAALPGVEVLITARDARLLAKDKTLDPGEPQVKLRGGYPGGEDEAERDVRARRPRRIARGPRRAGPHARAGRVPGPARRDAVLRRRVLHARRRRDDREAEPALSAAHAGDLAPPDRARHRPGAARAGPAAARAGSRQGRRVARARDGPRDRPRAVARLGAC